MAASPSRNLLAENSYLKQKLQRNAGLAGVARDRATRIEELEAEIQELMQRSSVADLDSAVGRLRGAHKAEMENLRADHKCELEKLEAGRKKVVEGLQVEITRLEGEIEKGHGGKIGELRRELHEGEDRLSGSGSGYRYVEVATYFRVKEELQGATKRLVSETKGRQTADRRLKEVKGQLKEAQEEIAGLKERLAANKLVIRGPASNSPAMIKEVVREAVDGIRGRSRGGKD